MINDERQIAGCLLKLPDCLCAVVFELPLAYAGNLLGHFSPVFPLDATNVLIDELVRGSEVEPTLQQDMSANQWAAGLKLRLQ
nr:hypothetical protein [Gordonia polyisoprenivorans]